MLGNAYATSLQTVDNRNVGAAPAANSPWRSEQFAAETACMVTLARNLEDKRCRDGRDMLAGDCRLDC